MIIKKKNHLLGKVVFGFRQNGYKLKYKIVNKWNLGKKKKEKKGSIWEITK